MARLAGGEAGARQLLHPRLARARAAGDGGHPRLARQPRAGLPGRRARLRGHGLRGSTSPSPRATACPSWSPASSRWTCCRASSSPCAQLEEGRVGVENQYARAVTPRGQPAGAGADARGVRGLRPRLARHRRHPRQRPARCAPGLRALRRGAAVRRRRRHRRRVAAVHRRAGAAGPEEAARVPGVRHALHAGAPARARRWSPPRAPAPPTTATRGRREPSRRGRRPPTSTGRSAPSRCSEYPHVTLAHGGGGRLTHTLIERMFLAAFRNPALEPLPRRRRARGAGRAAGLHAPTPTWCSPLLLPRRRHRLAGRARHGERPGHVRGAAAGPDRGLHPRGGPAHGRAAGASSRSMARAARRGGREHRHRRHQGGGPRQGRRPLHQHRPASAWCRRACDVGPGAVRARATGCC